MKEIVGFVFKTDVVVNSISSDLMLNREPLSRALLEKAGPKLQEELNTTGQRMSINVGTVLQTSGCNLHCQRVLHVVAPDWENGSTSSHKVGPGFQFSRKFRTPLNSFHDNVDWTLFLFRNNVAF